MYNSEWYNSLTKPVFSPPDWVFAPVWMVLYTLLFISFIIYVSKKEKDKTRGFVWFILQLVFNIAWSPAFFFYENMCLALVIVFLLDIAVFMTIKEFYRVSKVASYLLFPYFVWVLFATYLNAGYIILN